MTRPETTGAALIGIDIGTTSVKAGLFAADGQVLSAFGEPYTTGRPRPGHVEQDPEEWWALLRKALVRFAAHPAAGAVAGIGICSQVNTHVFCDAAGRPLMPAIVWQDGRAAAEAAELDAAISEADRLDWFGAHMPVDASHPLSRILHVRRNRPEVWAETARVMSPKDWALLRLTGEAVADAVASVGLAGRDLAPVLPLIRRVEGAEAVLPPFRGVTEVAGRIRPGLPFAGLPVVTGTMDAWAGLFGVNALAPGQAMYLGGTSEILGLSSPAVTPTPGVIVFPPHEGITLHAAPTQAGGAALDWAARLLGRQAEEMSLLATGADLAAVPVFLPHLQGERAPLWDIASRGAFAGLDGATGPAEIARAVMEGVAAAARWAFEALEASAGLRAARIACAGGGFRSGLWAQIRADMFGRDLTRMAALDAGTLGAAVMAGTGTGLFPSLAEAAAALAREERIFRPDPASRERMEATYARVRETYAALRPLHHGLTAERARP